MRPTNAKANPPSASTGTAKSVEGRACSCCGKTFGRPSALKVGSVLCGYMIWRAENNFFPVRFIWPYIPGKKVNFR
jgi:hypothetical protein